MKQSLIIALITSLLIVLSHGETTSKVLPTLELRQLEDALETYDHVIVLFEDHQ